MFPFNSHQEAGSDGIVICSNGTAVSKAVTVVELLKRRIPVSKLNNLPLWIPKDASVIVAELDTGDTVKIH